MTIADTTEAAAAAADVPLKAKATFLQRRGLVLPASVAKQTENFFRFVPKELRVGPWSWFPLITLIAIFLVAAILAVPALQGYQPMEKSSDFHFWCRLVGWLYGMGVMVYMVKYVGVWPMVSWTVMGWMVTTLRYGAGTLGLVGLQRVLTFPSLMTNTVTVLIWYTVLVPGIILMSPKKARNKILNDWVFDWFLATIHGVNWPFCILDWYFQPIPLNLFDLWVSALYCVAYISFYLGVLDPAGVHLYFILSPRKWWGSLVYIGIVGLVVAIWYGVNMAQAWISAGTAADAAAALAAGGTAAF